MTVSELAATGSAAVLVPLEAVGQQANAAALARADAAIVVPQGERGRLPEMIDDLAGDPAQLAALQARAADAGNPEAAGVVADAVMEALDG